MISTFQVDVVRGHCLVICQGILLNLPLFWTSQLTEDGQCYTYTIWSDLVALRAYAYICAFWLYVFLLVEMLYCYGRIILKLRKKSAIAPVICVQQAPANQNEGFSGPEFKPTNQESGASKRHIKQANQEEGISKHQINVIKTMIIISVTYALTTSLNNFGFIAASYDPKTPIMQYPQYYINVALYYVNVWIDPFIYVLGNREMRHLFLKYFLVPVTHAQQQYLLPDKLHSKRNEDQINLRSDRVDRQLQHLYSCFKKLHTNWKQTHMSLYNWFQQSILSEQSVI